MDAHRADYGGPAGEGHEPEIQHASAVRRRSQRDKTTRDRFWPLVDRWIPRAKILIRIRMYASRQFIQGRSRVQQF